MQKAKHDIEELIKLNEVEEQTQEDLLDDESPVFERAQENPLEEKEDLRLAANGFEAFKKARQQRENKEFAAQMTLAAQNLR